MAEATSIKDITLTQLTMIACQCQFQSSQPRHVSVECIQKTRLSRLMQQCSQIPLVTSHNLNSSLTTKSRTETFTVEVRDDGESFIVLTDTFSKPNDSIG